MFTEEEEEKGKVTWTRKSLSEEKKKKTLPHTGRASYVRPGAWPRVIHREKEGEKKREEKPQVWNHVWKRRDGLSLTGASRAPSSFLLSFFHSSIIIIIIIRQYLCFPPSCKYLGEERSKASLSSPLSWLLRKGKNYHTKLVLFLSHQPGRPLGMRRRRWPSVGNETEDQPTDRPSVCELFPRLLRLLRLERMNVQVQGHSKSAVWGQFK